MTSAGIGTMAICLLHQGKEPLDDTAIRRGLVWLVKNWKVSENPELRQYHYYYIYGLERLGSILNTEFIGSNEWYPQGRGFWLTPSQRMARGIKRDVSSTLHSRCSF